MKNRRAMYEIYIKFVFLFFMLYNIILRKIHNLNPIRIRFIFLKELLLFRSGNQVKF